MIDWSRVRELREEVGEEDFVEVLDLFLEEVEEVLDRLAPGAGAEQMMQDMHFLKGGALSLGFAAFSEMCQAGEKLATAGQTDGIELDKIIEAYVQSKSMFLREMDNRIAA